MSCISLLEVLVGFSNSEGRRKSFQSALRGYSLYTHTPHTHTHTHTHHTHTHTTHIHTHRTTHTHTHKHTHTKYYSQICLRTLNSSSHFSGMTYPSFTALRLNIILRLISNKIHRDKTWHFRTSHKSGRSSYSSVFEDVYVVCAVLRTREPDDACAIVNGGTDHSQILLWSKVSSIAHNIALEGQIRRGSKGLISWSKGLQYDEENIRTNWMETTVKFKWWMNSVVVVS